MEKLRIIKNWFNSIFSFDQVMILTVSVLLSVLTLVTLISGIVFTELNNGLELSEVIVNLTQIIANIATVFGIGIALSSLGNWKRVRSADTEEAIRKNASEAFILLNNIKISLFQNMTLQIELGEIIDSLRERKEALIKNIEKFNLLHSRSGIYEEISRKADKGRQVLIKLEVFLENLIDIYEKSKEMETIAKKVRERNSRDDSWDAIEQYTMIQSRYFMGKETKPENLLKIFGLTIDDINNNKISKPEEFKISVDQILSVPIKDLYMTSQESLIELQELKQ